MLIKQIGFTSFLAGLFTIAFIACQNETKQKQNTLFYKIPSSDTNVDFSNILEETDDFNIIEYLYFYNGGGVAAGDINNDGLIDLYFTSNQGKNALYLNKGNFKFENITEKAGVSGIGNWKTGVTMADVNGDGLLDIFVCGVGNYKKFNGRNQLFINQGNLTFTDQTENYGLGFQGFSTHASFFDYDNDEDLDMYLLNHSVHSVRTYGESFLRFQSDPLAGDKLYRNDLIPSGVNHFTEVTSQAGIFNSQIGYGLGVGVSDLNLDGYLDIYVSNDFHENDYLYINQGNGTFKQELEKSIPHSSRFSMGNDIADINNDGWCDIFTLDMLPKDEAVIKTTAGDDPYDIYQFKLRFGYHHQLARNALQLNRGVTANGKLIFSDIAPMAGIEASDWSWAPLLADFDNDGFKDLFIANGIVRRPNDLDYINYISGDSAQRFLTDRQFIEKMPSGSVPNVIYRNQHDLTFKDVTEEWLGIENGISNGAIYADLDNDGDLDIVTNNINEKAFIYRNDLPSAGSKYLKIKLHGSDANRLGIGARVTVYAGDKKMFFEQIPSRGWQSSVDYTMHAGLGEVTIVDSVSVIWPDQGYQNIRSVKTNQLLNIHEKDASSQSQKYKVKSETWSLQSAKDSLFIHRENDFVSFNVEKLMPHMLTTQGPKLAIGDINGDKLSDFFIGGAGGQAGAIFIQTRNGNFIESYQPSLMSDSSNEDAGATFFDADGNGMLDLIVVSGGQQYKGNNKNLLPRLYLNNGKGNLKKAPSHLPQIFVDASCIKPGDIDADGDLDLFIGGKVIAGQYGIDPKSYILINDGKGIFTDQSDQWLGVKPLGMVSDAIWIDINKDKKMDLVLVGEWMPVTILIQNDKGMLEKQTSSYNLENTNGWWNTIAAHDFDKDGDIDLIAGNLGLNSRLRASVTEPVNIFIQDIDNNGALDHIMTYYNQGKEHPFISRDQLVKQVPSLKRKFLKYESFRDVQLKDILPADSSKYEKKTTMDFASVYIENTGDGEFTIHSLPSDAQIFPIFSFCIDDINNDGHADILAVGNLNAVQPDIGRYDAGYGLVLLGNGKGKFSPIGHEKSGFLVAGEGRDIKSLVNSKGDKIYLVSRNNSSLMIFKHP